PGELRPVRSGPVLPRGRCRDEGRGRRHSRGGILAALLVVGGMVMTDEARARETLYVQFSDYGQHIRKWSLEPFDGALAFAQPPSPTVETVLAYEAGIEEGKRQLGNQGESLE